MSQYFTVHPSHPQQRLIHRAAEIINSGGLVVYPTDTTYALGCHIGDKTALDRIRLIRRLDKNHQFTLTGRNLSDLSTYARIDNSNYRTLKHFTPGPFTFLLPATREVPNRLVHPKRKTIGLRIPDHAIALSLLEAMQGPLMTTSMRLPNASVPLSEPEEIREQLEALVDVIIDGGSCGVVPTTVVDLTATVPEIIRQGLGVLA
ncbi:MAG: L-threonylcarbamoyladenylate synthase [Proteobacteria bacterium]|nr:L-threonylcarbamoyladenylate synthase [Pseudomonadota bacterium]